MLTHTDFRRGVKIILDGEPYEILDSQAMKKAQRRVVIQARIKNLITGTVMDKNFHQGDTAEEAEMTKIEVKFLYSHKGQFFFCEKNDPSKRFSLTSQQIGNQARFFKSNQILEGLVFENKVVGVSLPIKIFLKIIEAPPGVKGERAQAGTKIAVLETKTPINVPLFVEQGDIIEVNTETGEYIRRIDKK
jgi:elongation factor P